MNHLVDFSLVAGLCSLKLVSKEKLRKNSKNVFLITRNEIYLFKQAIFFKDIQIDSNSIIQELLILEKKKNSF